MDVQQEGLAGFAEYGEAFVGHVADVTREADLAAGVEAAVGTFGALDVAFNVAGVSRGAPIVDLDEETWDFTVDRVLKGVYLSTKHEARAMRATGRGGAIVNMSSLNAHVPMHTGAAYASAKAGVEMFTKNAALEMARDGIRVNAVLPGLIDTPLTQRRLVNKPLMDAWLERIPQGRPGRPRRSPRRASSSPAPRLPTSQAPASSSTVAGKSPAIRTCAGTRDTNPCGHA